MALLLSLSQKCFLISFSNFLFVPSSKSRQEGQIRRQEGVNQYPLIDTDMDIDIVIVDLSINMMR